MPRRPLEAQLRAARPPSPLGCCIANPLCLHCATKGCTDSIGIPCGIRHFPCGASLPGVRRPAAGPSHSPPRHVNRLPARRRSSASQANQSQRCRFRLHVRRGLAHSAPSGGAAAPSCWYVRRRERAELRQSSPRSRRPPCQRQLPPARRTGSPLPLPSPHCAVTFRRPGPSTSGEPAASSNSMSSPDSPCLCEHRKRHTRRIAPHLDVSAPGRPEATEHRWFPTLSEPHRRHRYRAPRSQGLGGLFEPRHPTTASVKGSRTRSRSRSRPGGSAQEAPKAV